MTEEQILEILQTWNGETVTITTTSNRLNITMSARLQHQVGIGFFVEIDNDDEFTRIIIQSVDSVWQAASGKIIRLKV